MITVTVSRSAKINIGNYENTDVGVELSAQFEDISMGLATLSVSADTYLRQRVDEIELSLKKDKSKAARFGV
jgi:hypothetical protein